MYLNIVKYIKQSSRYYNLQFIEAQIKSAKILIKQKTKDVHNLVCGQILLPF